MESEDTNEFPSDENIRRCLEPGCDEPCVKRGRGYARFCGTHLFNHTVEDTAPKSQRGAKREVGDDPKIVAEKKTAVEKKAEQQALALLSILQITLMAQKDDYCAWAVGETSDDIAKNLGKVAGDIKLVARLVDRSDKYFALLLLSWNVSRLGLMMATHHDIIPYHDMMKMVGVPKPPAHDENVGKSPKLKVLKKNADTPTTTAEA